MKITRLVLWTVASCNSFNMEQLLVTWSYIYTHTYIHVYIHIHTYICTYTQHTHIYIHTNTHTYIHAYIHTHTHTYLRTYLHMRRCYPKVPEMYQKKSRHTKSPNHHHPLQSSPFGSVHNDPNISAMIGSCHGSPFVSARSAIQPGSPVQCEIFAPATWFSSYGRGRRHRGLNQASKGVGDSCHVSGGQKLLHSQSGVCGCFVMMVQPVVLVPFVWPLPSQDVAVELHIDGLSWRDRFLTHNPINVEKADQHWLHIAFYLPRFHRPG
jgi:hypothetical protein